MRIISQNGMDFPYEHIVVYTDENSVMCRTFNDEKKYCLGVYEDCKRANDVFKSIFDYYKVTPQMEDGCTLYMNNVFVMPEE